MYFYAPPISYFYFNKKTETEKLAESTVELYNDIGKSGCF